MRQASVTSGFISASLMARINCLHRVKSRTESSSNQESASSPCPPLWARRIVHRPPEQWRRCGGDDGTDAPFGDFQALSEWHEAVAGLQCYDGVVDAVEDGARE